jgi:hypothetical protein
MPELPYPRRVLARPRRPRLRARAGKLFDKFATPHGLLRGLERGGKLVKKFAGCVCFIGFSCRTVTNKKNEFVLDSFLENDPCQFTRLPI